MLIFGVNGYFTRKPGFPVAPTVLASVLAQILETSPCPGPISHGSLLLHLFQHPHCPGLHGLAVLSIGRGIWGQSRTKAPEVALDEADQSVPRLSHLFLRQNQTCGIDFTAPGG